MDEKFIVHKDMLNKYADSLSIDDELKLPAKILAQYSEDDYKLPEVCTLVDKYPFFARVKFTVYNKDREKYFKYIKCINWIDLFVANREECYAQA